MAPRDIEQQTSEIISCLFNDYSALDRSNTGGFIEPDGPCDDDDTFDAALIADQLRALGDDYDEKVIQPLLKKLEQAAADQVVEAFGQSVETLCQARVAQRAEVASEMQLLRASVTLCLYAKKSSPALIGKVQSAMEAFVNNRLTGWLTQQGGWGQVVS